MNTYEARTYNALSRRIGRRHAENLVDFVKGETKSEMRSFSKIFMTKEDKIELFEKISANRGDLTAKINTAQREMDKKINTVETRLTEKISAVQNNLNAVEARLSEKINTVQNNLNVVQMNLEYKINTTKSELIKWMAGFWFAAIALIVSILKFL
ncbi:hypothetical protein [Anseongella ginsenosidimutans]|nr:hypothetical protein [Anseongella ginsenosidimutans]QEC51069.1 hypothetical protein FRZ59_01015 [Anseongella ginsenosidimutans]